MSRWADALALVSDVNLADLLFHFQLHSNCIYICLSLYLRLFFKIQFYKLCCYPDTYHTNNIWKSSVLYENVSSSLFNNTLVLFLCLSLYLSFCCPNCLQFYKLSYVILNFNIHMFDENLQFYQKMSLFLFQFYSHSFFKPIIVSVNITTKIFKFYSFPMNFHHCIRYRLCKLLNFIRKYLNLIFLLYYIICMPTIASVKITTKIFKY